MCRWQLDSKDLIVCLKTYGQIHNIVQEEGTKAMSKKKECEDPKWLYEEGLKIAEKRVKGKGEKERYTQLNAEFHWERKKKKTKRDKKAFWNK